MLSYYDNIIKALQNGTTEEEIALQFTKDLNAACDDFRGKTMYDEAIHAFKCAWNDAIDAYAFYKGLDDGVKASDLYMKVDDDPIETMIATYMLVKDITETLKNVTAADALGFEPSKLVK